MNVYMGRIYEAAKRHEENMVQVYEDRQRALSAQAKRERRDREADLQAEEDTLS